MTRLNIRVFITSISYVFSAAEVYLWLPQLWFRLYHSGFHLHHILLQPALKLKWECSVKLAPIHELFLVLTCKPEKLHRFSHFLKQVAGGKQAHADEQETATCKEADPTIQHNVDGVHAGMRHLRSR